MADSDDLKRRGGRQAFEENKPGFPSPYGIPWAEYKRLVDEYYKEQK